MDKGPGNDVSAIACALTEAEQRARRNELTHGLLGQIRGIRELADGYELQFDGTSETIEILGQFIATESRCCPILRFELDVPPHCAPIVLRLRGPANAKAFLASWLLPHSVAAEP